MEIQPNHRIGNHVRNFERLLSQYTFDIPLSKFLQDQFRLNRKMGSKDRKMATRFAYNFFRIGNLGEDLEFSEKLLIAEFLCEKESDLVSSLKPEWQGTLTADLTEKLVLVEKEFQVKLEEVFPVISEITSEIDSTAFLQNLLRQPLFFIRVKKGKMHKVQHILAQNQITYSQKAENILVLPHHTALDKIPDLQGLVEVQDYSSQQTLNDVQPEDFSLWWDVCSGSGGKSLLLLDKNPKIKLMASDIRPSILKNLVKRFDAANILDYHTKELDMSSDNQKVLGNTRFDGIICDVPCSGSGTWGSSPENLSKFDVSKIEKYADLQKRILKNAYYYLKEGKTLVYITCSVFQKENEDVVNEMQKELNFEIKKMQYLEGASHQADTLFVAYIQK